jgi:hypothetical protein
VSRFLLTMVVAMTILAPLRAREQQFLEGLWLGVESGGVIELIAWAETVRHLPWKMANGSLEDAPVIPRTYRILSSMPAWKVVGVVMVTSDIFVKDPERVDNIPLPFSATRLSTTAFEIGIPALEKWENVLRYRKQLKATDDQPLYCFITLTNGTIVRMYPFRVDRPDERR